MILIFGLSSCSENNSNSNYKQFQNFYMADVERGHKSCCIRGFHAHLGPTCG